MSQAQTSIWSLGGSQSEFENSGQSDAERMRPLITTDYFVLDLGCGIGRVTKYIAPLCRTVYGVDASKRMIFLAKKRLIDYDNVSLFINNGKDLMIFLDNKFDFVFCLEFFQHLEKKDAYIYMKEIFRVLKRNGIAYLQFPNLLCKYYFDEFVKNIHINTQNDIARMRYYTEQEIKIKIESVGFKIVILKTDDRGKGIGTDCDIIAICRKELS